MCWNRDLNSNANGICPSSTTQITKCGHRNSQLAEFVGRRRQYTDMSVYMCPATTWVLQYSTANQHSPCNTAQPISTVLTIQHSQPAQCLQHSTANQHWLNKHSSQSQDRSHTATKYQYNISPLMDNENNDNTLYKSKLWLTDLKVEADSAFVSCL